MAGFYVTAIHFHAAEEVLHHFRDRFIREMNANSIVMDLEYMEISVATIIAIHDISRYIHNIAIQKQCSSCRDIGLISADWCRRANLC